MMRYILPALLVLVSSAPSALAARQPKPVPSAAAQMLEQLAVGDGRNWIEKAEAMDYLSRYEVPGAAAAVKAILENQRANRWLRGRALVAMARIEPANAAALADAYSKGGCWELRAAAAEICATLSKDKATPVIKRLLAENTPQVKFGALAAHARHCGVDAWAAAEPMMAKVPTDCVEPAARALGWIGTEPARTRLLALAKQPQAVPAVLRGLRGIPNDSLVSVYLNLAAASRDAGVLADAWQGMHAFPRGKVVAACRAGLASGDDNRVRVVARIIARYLREPVLGDALQAALKTTKDRTTLQIGLAALSCVEADRFEAFFLTHLAGDDPATRVAAVRCLAQCGKVKLYEVLAKALGDADKTVRITALETLRIAPAEQSPRQGVVEYFTPSLLSTDAPTRKTAIEAIAPRITPDNGEAAFAVMRKMLEKFGAAGAEPLMRAVFRVSPAEKSAEILQAQGYVARWHVIGAFPAGFGGPKENVDGLSTVYPPEKKVDLSEKIAVKYNTKADTRFGKKVGEAIVHWVPATVGNADGTLYMTKAGRSRLQMPRRNGVCYAYTEITVPAKTSARVTFLFNARAGDRVWLNGKVLALAAKVDSKQGISTKTADVTLNAGANRVLVKVVSNDYSSAWWAPKVSNRGFVLSLTDAKGKPVKWSHK